MDLEKAKIDYEEKGYALIPGVFPRFDMQALQREAYRLLDTAFGKSQTQFVGKHPALMFGMSDLSYAFYAYTHSPELREIVTFFLGNDVRQLNCQNYFRESGDGDQFQWHNDLIFRTPLDDFDSIESGYLQTVIAIDDVGEDNGAVEFIPGSHKRPFQNIVPRDNSERGLREFKRMGLKGEKLCMKSGDVAIWNVLTVHGSEQNNSGRSRMQFMNGFCRESSLINKTRFPIY